jgi:mannose-6-phosphate isomerase-like protein (cupin superfamily)
VTRAPSAALTLLVASLAACRSAHTPPPPPPPPKASAASAGGPSLRELLATSGTPALQPYLDAYPLGDQGSRSDLIASDERRSMHFVQVRRATPRHVHPARTETVYVLTGSGTCYIGDRSYPVEPGSAFRIAPGVPHTAIPAEGATIVAIVYFEPPLTEGDDRVVVK